MDLKNKEQAKSITNLEQEVRKLKVHKKVLKEEVISLRSQLNDQELKASNKAMQLKNLGEFFKKQTDGLLLEGDMVQRTEGSA